MPSSRRSYTVMQKLLILEEYQCGVQGKGFHAVGKRHGRLYKWAAYRNSKDLRVKDSYIRLQAANIYRELHGNDAIGFEASSDWLARFKGRRNLVSRRQTTTRTLTADAPAICQRFIQQAQRLIAKHGIKTKNIINMDQVPRYFETEPKSAITTCGSRALLLRKGGSSYKRFTAT
ncbi:uncharacterized protein PITG_01151 [Phytophthora infestans T30-4]|uniref:HTH CENPB-type domain-containing protein n=1 Tax=Phytophthora infestans (strain T30-4) TaxID=403677 RepID=D0MSL2_PHYIT|nr:uncharacterized protein PITG_01151 [Phytophthora infestans T30-4]EEY58481.1 conserved hypothetical protein [Phytophthora infestans T30-4]|eukprot:XP_002909667.1 conserved hypothetical protein [Phytophthora infestans T30-4]